MKEAMRKSGPVAAIKREHSHRLRKRMFARCSVCASRVFFRPIRLMEPVGVPEPRLTWMLCGACYHALLAEMRRSPIKSPLRLRIAIGLVASERWPQAYPTRIRTFVSDRKWIIAIAVGFITAMILHLALIVAIAGMR